MNTSIQTDILIIGSGLSGDVVAFIAADEGKDVLFITKISELKSGNTPWAKGGIVYTSQSDSPDKLKTDIAQVGDHPCWDEAVELICNEGPPLVKILRNLQNEIEILYQNAKLTPDMIGLRNGVQTANAIIAATLEA